ncbi:MAG: hypothetical protein ACFBSC_14395 [Microcoleaceae cyanobacterium]
MKQKGTSQATAFVGGCLFAVLAALSVLVAWLMFGNVPRRGQVGLPQFNTNLLDNSNPFNVNPFNSSQGSLPPAPPYPTLPYNGPPSNLGQPYSGPLGQPPYGVLPPSPVLPPPPSTNPPGESSSGSQLRTQLDQQQNVTQQLTTQLDQQRSQNDQLRGQLDQQRIRIEQLTSQFEQQRIRTEQLMLQMQDQQRTMIGGSGQIRPIAQQPMTVQSAVLWTLVGIVLALLLGGSVVILSLIALVAQPQPRRVLRRYPLQSVNLPLPYEFYEESGDFFQPHLRPRRSR